MLLPPGVLQLLKETMQSSPAQAWSKHSWQSYEISLGYFDIIVIFIVWLAQQFKMLYNTVLLPSYRPSEHELGTNVTFDYKLPTVDLSVL